MKKTIIAVRIDEDLNKLTDVAIKNNNPVPLNPKISKTYLVRNAFANFIKKNRTKND